MTQGELETLRPMQKAMTDADQQVRACGKTLEKRHNNLRLRKYAVVSLGFERIWWAEV